jgi:3-dehydroquinate dehydratase/shikimate dehydrogenase
MVRICLCLTGPTLQRDLEMVKKYRDYIDLLELRVDCLDYDEQLHIRSFPGMAGLPVILTIKRQNEGGAFREGEGARITLMARGLAFAELNPRRNYAYVDLEEDLVVPSIEEAARSFGIRIIRSFHFTDGMPDNLVERLDGLYRMGDEIAKATLTPQNLNDVRRIYRIADEMDQRDRIILAIGEYGLNTRLLAEKLHSYIAYTSVKGEPDFPLASPGQLDPAEMMDTYHFRNIKANSRIYASTGWPLAEELRPAILNRVFAEERSGSVYIPFPSDNFASFLDLAEDLHIQGVSVAEPYREKALECLSRKSVVVDKIGTCNTLLRISLPGGQEGWEGYNTDLQGFSDSLLKVLHVKNFKGLRITLIGAGAEARAAAAAIYSLHGRCLILNRIDSHARALAKLYHFRWEGLNSLGLGLMERYSDVIVLAMEGSSESDSEADLSLLDYNWRGNEVVMSIVSKPTPQAFLEQARAAGCLVLTDRDMLYRETARMYQLFTGKDFPAHILGELEKQNNERFDNDQR